MAVAYVESVGHITKRRTQDMKELASLSTAKLRSPPRNAEGWWMIRLGRRRRAFDGSHTTRPQQVCDSGNWRDLGSRVSRQPTIVRNEKKMRQTDHNHVNVVLKLRMETTYILWRLLKGEEPRKGKHVKSLAVVDIESAARWNTLIHHSAHCTCRHGIHKTDRCRLGRIDRNSTAMKSPLSRSQVASC